MTQPNFDPPVQDGGISNGQPQDHQQQGDGGEEPKLNPAWQGLLGKIPDQNLQKLIIPELQQWDKNYTQGIQKVHSEYAGYKPFLDQKIDPKQINDAMLVFQALEQDPASFVQNVMDYYQLELEQGQEDPQGDGEQYDPGDGQQPFDLEADPRFQQYADMTRAVAQYAVAQQEELAQQKAEAELDAEIAAAKKQHGDFDEAYVVQRMHYYDENIDDAVKAYQSFVNNVVQNHRSPGSTAPVIMGGGGGTPSQQVQVSGLSGQDRRKLIAETLARLNAPGG